MIAEFQTKSGENLVIGDSTSDHIQSDGISRVVLKSLRTMARDDIEHTVHQSHLSTVQLVLI